MTWTIFVSSLELNTWASSTWASQTKTLRASLNLLALGCVIGPSEILSESALHFLVMTPSKHVHMLTFMSYTRFSILYI